MWICDSDEPVVSNDEMKYKSVVKKKTPISEIDM